MWSIDNQGSSMQAFLLLRPHHIGSLCLECAKIPNSHKESRVGTLFTQTAQVQWATLRLQRQPSQNLSFQTPAKGLHYKQCFSRITVETWDVNCFLHSQESCASFSHYPPRDSWQLSGSPELQSCDKVSWGPHSSHKGRDSWFSAMLPGAFEDTGPVGEHHSSQG